VSDQFKALVLNQEGDNFTREVKSVDKSFLKHGDVTIKVDYSDLNFKDGMILKNGGRLVKEFPHIPGIDFSGKVIESENSKFKEGDEVILTGFRVGEIFFGGYSQIAKVNADFLIKKPDSLTTKEAMILGTAGFTSLMSAFAIQARESILLGEKVNDVLVTGATGGVGSVAIMALTKMGYNVSAVTGKDSKSDYLKSLGAKNIINRFFLIISSLREEIDKLKNNLIELPKELVVHVHQGSIDYPRDENGDIDGLIHPERINQDWKMIKKGDPLFFDSQGIIHQYERDQFVWPVFIGEVAYKEKKIAMSYTKKEVICSKKQWVQEFESL